MKNNEINEKPALSKMAVSGSVTASELRIGNLIYYHFDKKELNMISVNLETLKNIYYENYESENLIGILLTEEWLEKLGFDKCEFNIPDKFKKANCSFSVKYRKENGFTVEYKYGHVYLKTVHQLQNLYFALTGLELQLVL